MFHNGFCYSVLRVVPTTDQHDSEEVACWFSQPTSMLAFARQKRVLIFFVDESAAGRVDKSLATFTRFLVRSVQEAFANVLDVSRAVGRDVLFDSLEDLSINERFLLRLEVTFPVAVVAWNHTAFPVASIEFIADAPIVAPVSNAQPTRLSRIRVRVLVQVSIIHRVGVGLVRAGDLPLDAFVGKALGVGFSLANNGSNHVVEQVRGARGGLEVVLGVAEGDSNIGLLALSEQRLSEEDEKGKEKVQHVGLHGGERCDWIAWFCEEVCDCSTI